MYQIQASAFVETVGCNGPRYKRIQPSRETAGVTLNQCQDKYITEFDLPYRNMTQTLNEIDNNWTRISPQNRSLLQNKMSQLMQRGQNQGPVPSNY